MTIVPIPLKESRSVVEFFKKGGEVEVPRLEECVNEQCQLKKPMRKNGKYARQVIYWGLCFLVKILRFRCKRCGKTASCPYGWLVPYRRYSAEVIAAGIEEYASAEVRYRDLEMALSDPELVAPEMAIQELYKKIVEKGTVKEIEGFKTKPSPAHTTVFYWVDFACEHIEMLLMQLQKESVQEKKRGKEVANLKAESLVENPNSYKAASTEKGKMLDRLSFLTYAARQLFGPSKLQWYRLRAYFLTKAESRKDVLTDTWVQMSITHSFELAFF